MELNVIWKHARTAALECCEGSVYEMEEPCSLSLYFLIILFIMEGSFWDYHTDSI